MSYLKTALACGLFAMSATASAAQLLVLNKADATLAFIEPTSGKVETTLATGEGPHEIELSSDGKLAFVGNYGARDDGNTLSVVDVAARKELRRIDLGDLTRPHGLTIANQQLYFTSERAKKIARLDAKSERVDWTFPTDQEGTHMVLAAKSGGALYTTNIQAGTVSIIERRNGDQWQQTLVTVGAGPEGLDLSPDGRELWIGQSRDGGISIIDTATKKVSYTFNAQTKRSNRVKFTPDGRWVLVSDLGAGELVVFDARTRTERARIAMGRAPTGILIPPKSPHAFVAVSGENRIALVDLKSFTISKTIPTGGSPDGMAWVP
jgi:YVTN family beta-propeller protein